MMAIGGLDSKYTAEIVDLSGHQLSCPYIPDSPIDDSSVGTFINERAVVCGGYNQGDPTKVCLSYDQIVSQASKN